VIASTPARLGSLLILSFVVLVAVKGVSSGEAAGGGVLDGDGLGRRAGTVAAAGAGNRTHGVVAYVVDGDTVKVTTAKGQVRSVRLLGISAPETPHPGKAGECYGHRSTVHLKQLLPVGTAVALIADPRQADFDHYGRWLRYVEVAGRDVGRAQVLAGVASARRSANPVARHRAYLKVESRARSRGAGMWTACESASGRRGGRQ
jgi:micrococcal nuclease